MYADTTAPAFRAIRSFTKRRGHGPCAKLSRSLADFPFDVEDADDSGPSTDTLASRVLIVDDEQVVLDVMTRLFSREPDLSVESLDNAEEALARIRDTRVDVLITDKNLPGMGGIELIEQARRIRPALEAVMITGYASGESVIAAFAAGATDYLLKPFDDLRAVRAKIRAALDRRKDRTSSRHKARALAKEAKELLELGKDAPEKDWQRLEGSFRRYEAAIREGGRGQVAVVGSDRAVSLLSASEDFFTQRVEPDSLSLFDADVAVLETTHPAWRAAADRLVEKDADVILLASESADLSDLLEAISLRLELVGYGGKNVGSLGDRVRELLMRQAVQRAQEDLSSALTAFRQALSAVGQ